MISSQSDIITDRFFFQKTQEKDVIINYVENFVFPNKVWRQATHEFVLLGNKSETWWWGIKFCVKSLHSSPLFYHSNISVNDLKMTPSWILQCMIIQLTLFFITLREIKNMSLFVCLVHLWKENCITAMPQGLFQLEA